MRDGLVGNRSIQAAIRIRDFNADNRVQDIRFTGDIKKP